MRWLRFYLVSTYVVLIVLLLLLGLKCCTSCDGNGTGQQSDLIGCGCGDDAGGGSNGGGSGSGDGSDCGCGDGGDGDGGGCECGGGDGDGGSRDGGEDVGGDSADDEEDPYDSPVPVKEKFRADVVMCIDCTGSMDGIINTIKSNALNFYPDMRRKCAEKGKQITSMRLKVIAFRDFEDAPPFQESSFYDLPEQETDFKSFVESLVATGGGDGPERGYDALGLAMSSVWSKEPKTRQAIILWTDAASHPLSARSTTAKTFTELSDFWKNKMSKSGKRLIIFAPDESSWNAIEDSWENTKRHDVTSGGGLSDVDYEEIIDALSESI